MRAKYARRIRIGVVQALRDHDAVWSNKKRENLPEFEITDPLMWSAWNRAWDGVAKSRREIKGLPSYGWKDK